MIQLLDTGTSRAPVITCDVCKRRVASAALGAVVYNREALDLLHVHKGECLDEAERLVGEPSCWVELQTHLLQLIHNAGVSSG